MGIAPRSARRITRVDSAARDGDARVRQAENPRSAPQVEPEVLSRESPLQQLVVHTESSTASGLGVPRTVGEQAHRHRRSCSASPGADEPAECA